MNRRLTILRFVFPLRIFRYTHFINIYCKLLFIGRSLASAIKTTSLNKPKNKANFSSTSHILKAFRQFEMHDQYTTADKYLHGTDLAKPGKSLKSGTNLHVLRLFIYA